jgi:sulfite reductase alpha subunit-like flavoprotein
MTEWLELMRCNPPASVADIVACLNTWRGAVLVQDRTPDSREVVRALDELSRHLQENWSVAEQEGGR